jgi:hypothetical protein
MNLALLPLIVFGSGVLFALLLLARRLQRSEQKRRANWIATHPPLSDTAFAFQAGATNEQSVSIALRVRSIIADWAGVPSPHVYPDTSLADLSKLEWDGANEAELELSLEKTFDPKRGQVPTQTKTVKDLIRHCSDSH